MKILLIGGTGNISTACVRLAVSRGHDVTLLTRGNRKRDPSIDGKVSVIQADINDVAQVAEILADLTFDVIANFIILKPSQMQRDLDLFKGKCGQYIFISSASVYQKPLSSPIVTEGTPLANPYWDYSREKIACEELCIKAYRESGFPITIIRPSLTYDTVIPVAIGSWDDFTIVDRIRKDKPVIVHGDGTSLWTVTHSDDFAKGFVGLCGNQQAMGEAFHITSDELLTWDQIYDAVGAAAGTPVIKVHIPSEFISKIVPWQEGNLLGDKSASAIFDNSKLKRAVPDFKATIPFKVGITRTIKWFEADPSRMKIVDYANQMMDHILDRYNSVFDTLKPM
ncbi:MAG: NAD-dependent dehydratase [Phycisphaeraceae bacterium]|nr:NAD-dependent dehydratase [Phycisphaeraceae bacterium]